MTTWLCFLSCRSLRDLLFMLFLIVMVSMIMTLHIGNNLPWMRQRSYQQIPENAENNRNHVERVRAGSYLTHQKSSHRKLSHFPSSSHLAQLVEIEERVLSQTNTRTVAISGNQQGHRGILNGIIRKHGLQVDEVSDGQWLPPIPADRPTLLCLGSAGSHCHEQLPEGPSQGYMRVNRIPELNEYFARRGAICKLQKRLRSHEETKVVEADCFQLPSESLNLKRSLSGGQSSAWVVSQTPDGSLQILHTNLTRDDIDDLKKETEVVWTVSEASAMGYLKLYTLVMSFLPQRAYVYPRAVLYPRLVSHSKSQTPKVVELMQFLKGLGEQYLNVTAEYVLETVKEAIFSSLIEVEYETLLAEKPRCSRCFQILEYYMTFDSKLHPSILQIKTHSYEEDWLQELMVDAGVADILFTRSTVAMDVARGLDNLVPDLTDMDCESGSALCLREQDYIYLLDNRRESLVNHSLIKLYPTKSASNYSHLVNWLQPPSAGGQARTLESIGGMDIPAQHPSQLRRRRTSDLHSLNIGLEKFYASLSGQDPLLRYNSLSVIVESMKHKPSQNTTYSKPYNDGESSASSSHRCSKDKGDVPLLLEIFTEPDIHFLPDFNPHVTQYHASIPHDLFLIKVGAEAKGCLCEARFNDIHGTSRFLNYTIGVGSNQIVIVVVDLSQNSPWVVNSYSLNIHRWEAENHLPTFSPALCQVCSFKQDCSMKFSLSESCGFKPVLTHSVWLSYQKQLQTLPRCGSGDITAKWTVPCLDCNQSNSCYWKHAVWQPEHCRHDVLSDYETKKCFSNKRVLFIGDSTNRGILHYITEKINGSLRDWDKTHDIRLYDNINNNRTIFSFAYYPQFWLPTNHRPTFIKALYQLIKRTLPLHNTSETVLVVGGVHWLAKHHVKVILSALQREGLTGITLIMKGLGAGFHQPVEGVRYVPQGDQYKLLVHEQDLSTYARQNGFHVIQTYNMTVARYKDFLQGKCACHFHKVVKTQNLDTRGINGESHYPTYHVEGSINAMYSEMVIHQICKFPNG